MLDIPGHLLKNPIRVVLSVSRKLVVFLLDPTSKQGTGNLSSWGFSQVTLRVGQEQGRPKITAIESPAINIARFTIVCRGRIPRPLYNCGWPRAWDG